MRGYCNVLFRRIRCSLCTVWCMALSNLRQLGSGSANLVTCETVRRIRKHTYSNDSGYKAPPSVSRPRYVVAVG